MTDRCRDRVRLSAFDADRTRATIRIDLLTVESVTTAQQRLGRTVDGAHDHLADADRQGMRVREPVPCAVTGVVGRRPDGRTRDNT